MNTEMQTYEPQQGVAVKNTATEMMISRQAQEVQAAMVVAKRFPRDEAAGEARILNACKRKSLAESAMYEFPRGTSKVTGPSIRLAEVLAQNWGNLDFGITELEKKSGESTVMAYCWDLETNTRQTKIFTVPHVRETKSGSVALTDSRDIYEMVANQGARRLRACILGIIPGDIVDKAISACNKTLAGGSKPLSERIDAMEAMFREKYGVPMESIEKYIGLKRDGFTEQTLVRLAAVHNSIKNGIADVSQFFELPDATAAPESDEALPFHVTEDGEVVAPEYEKADGTKQVSLDEL